MFIPGVEHDERGLDDMAEGIALSLTRVLVM